MPLPMITAIVFDFDGVIADSEVLHLRAVSGRCWRRSASN